MEVLSFVLLKGRGCLTDTHTLESMQGFRIGRLVSAPKLDSRIRITRLLTCCTSQVRKLVTV